MYTLYCDPSDGRRVTFIYGQCPGEVIREQTLEAPRAEVLLSAMDALVQGGPLEQLVLVNRADSFTLIRVLVTLYNTLAYSKQVPLYELTAPVVWSDVASQIQTSEVLLKPHYSGQPNITYAT